MPIIPRTTAEHMRRACGVAPLLAGAGKMGIAPALPILRKYSR